MRHDLPKVALLVLGVVLAAASTNSSNSTATTVAPQTAPMASTCDLLDTFGKLIQLLCGGLAFGVLIIKRFREKPRRSWCIWFMDVSKQCTSGLAAHFIGMLIAELIATASVSACSWYFVAYLVDSSLGMGLAYLFLKLGLCAAKACGCIHLMNSGDYGQRSGSGEVNKKAWVVQMMYWTFACVVPARFLCLGAVYALKDVFVNIAQWVQSLFSDPHVELVVVMLVGPLILNAVQFLVVDTFLKAPSPTHTLLDVDDDEADTESMNFIHNASDGIVADFDFDEPTPPNSAFKYLASSPTTNLGLN